MSRTDRELLTDAMRLIEAHRRGNTILVDWRDAVIEEIRVRLAEPEPEPEPKPVRWMDEDGCVFRDEAIAREVNPGQAITPLYRHPPRQTGLDQLLERIRFLEKQIAERKNQ